MLLLFELLTAFSLLVVMVIQKPGVKNKAYSQKHGIADVQNEYRRIADQTERDFWRKYPIVGIIVDRSRGVILWSCGFAFMTISSPYPFSPASIWTAIFWLGIAIQIVATVWYVTCGSITSYKVARALRSARTA